MKWPSPALLFEEIDHSCTDDADGHGAHELGKYALVRSHIFLSVKKSRAPNRKHWKLQGFACLIGLTLGLEVGKRGVCIGTFGADE